MHSHHILFIFLSTDEHQAEFHYLAVVYIETLTMDGQSTSVAVWCADLRTFEGVYKQRMKYMNHMATLCVWFLRSLYIDFHIGWTNLHFHQQCMRFFSLQLH